MTSHYQLLSHQLLPLLTAELHLIHESLQHGYKQLWQTCSDGCGIRVHLQRVTQQTHTAYTCMRLCCVRLVSWTTSFIRCGRRGPSWSTPTVGTSWRTSRRTAAGTARVPSSSRTTFPWRRVSARTSPENRSKKSSTKSPSKRTSCEQTYSEKRSTVCRGSRSDRPRISTPTRRDEICSVTQHALPR